MITWGIILDSSSDGMVKLSIVKNIDKLFADFPKEIRKACATPASDHLFKVSDMEETERLGKYLLEEEAQNFHHSVA